MPLKMQKFMLSSRLFQMLFKLIFWSYAYGILVVGTLLCLVWLFDSRFFFSRLLVTIGQTYSIVFSLSLFVLIVTVIGSFFKILRKRSIVLPLVILSFIVVANQSYNYRYTMHYNDLFYEELSAKSKEECFKQITCGTEKEINDAIQAEEITKIGCIVNPITDYTEFMTKIDHWDSGIEWACTIWGCKCFHIDMKAPTFN